MIKSIYISRPDKEIPALRKYAEQQGISLIASSQIRFEALSNKQKSPAEVIFFSSIRAAEYYLLHHEIESNVAIATIGSATATKLRELGLNPSFIGEKAGDPEAVTNEFKAWLQGRKVLIPCSTISNRSIAVSLPIEQVEELIVYKTISACSEVGSHAVYIFTSPSNFRAFRQCNTLPEHAQVIAWGKTTEKALTEAGIEPIYTLESSTEEELIAFISMK